MKRAVCEWCKNPFDAMRSDARYCSSAHRAAAAKQRRQTRTQPQRGPSQQQSSVLARELAIALGKLPRVPHDRGLAALARLYARTIDADPDQLKALGPQYLQVLTALGMTRGRASTLTPASVQPSPPPTGRTARAEYAPSKLDQLRARREARAP